MCKYSINEHLTGNYPKKLKHLYREKSILFQLIWSYTFV